MILEGGRARDAARELRLSRRTLLNWERRLGEGVVLRGRPRRVLDPESVRRVEASIAEVGPTLGVEPLKARFPEVSRRALRELLCRHRASYAREHAREVEDLTWIFPGAVWAMDHTEGPAGRRGIMGPILQVRDLASGKVLLWLEVRATAEGVRLVLEDLFRAEGVPLVLKSDNGSAFASELVREYLRSRGVTLLLSPPRRPRYNGSVEASMRWLKERTDHQARRLGAAAVWSPEALERARRISNALPRSAWAKAPESIWEARPEAQGGVTKCVSGDGRARAGAPPQRGGPCARGGPGPLSRSSSRAPSHHPCARRARHSSGPEEANSSTH